MRRSHRKSKCASHRAARERSSSSNIATSKCSARKAARRCVAMSTAAGPVCSISSQKRQNVTIEDCKMTVKLHVFPPSPRAFKVLAAANYLGIPYEISPVDFRTGAHRTPEYAQLNPNMKMPTLEDGDFVLWESNAI